MIAVWRRGPPPLALAVALAAVLAVAWSSARGEAFSDCEIDSCPAHVLRELWLAERRARIGWEAVATQRERERDDARALLSAWRAARLLEPPPSVPCVEPTLAPFVLVGAGACALCAGGAAAACAALGR